MDDTGQSQKPGFVDNMVGSLMTKYAPKIPVCYICREQIFGAHVDYTTKDRGAVKVCIGCVSKSLDFFIDYRNNSLKGK